MPYIFTILFFSAASSSPPTVAMQEFDSREACQVQMLYMQDKLKEFGILPEYTLLNCAPKGVIK
jgi:hypothetical protein